MSHLTSRKMFHVVLFFIFYSLAVVDYTFGAEEECVPGPYEHHVGAMLDLTEEQEQGLATTRCSYQSRLSEAQAQVDAAEKQFRADVKGLEEEEAIREAFISIAAAREQYVVLQVLMHKDTKKLLTAEQGDLMEALLDVEYLQKSVARTKQQVESTGITMQ